MLELDSCKDVGGRPINLLFGKRVLRWNVVGKKTEVHVCWTTCSSESVSAPQWFYFMSYFTFFSPFIKCWYIWHVRIPQYVDLISSRAPPRFQEKQASPGVREGSSGLSAVRREGVFSWSRASRETRSVSLTGASPRLLFDLTRQSHQPPRFTWIHVSRGEKKNPVYGPGWRFHDVSHRRGSPPDGKCL